MAALVIGAIDQKTTNASGAHLCEGDLLAGEGGHVPSMDAGVETESGLPPVAQSCDDGIKSVYVRKPSGMMGLSEIGAAGAQTAPTTIAAVSVPVGAPTRGRASIPKLPISGFGFVNFRVPNVATGSPVSSGLDSEKGAEPAIRCQPTDRRLRGAHGSSQFLLLRPPVFLLHQ
jgi:hypothetical protein